jgi:hypothetical protein
MRWTVVSCYFLQPFFFHLFSFLLCFSSLSLFDDQKIKGIDPLASTDPFGNYVSFTIWQEKKHFNAWRGGEAFKEAHGGELLLTSLVEEIHFIFFFQSVFIMCSSFL